MVLISFFFQFVQSHSVKVPRSTLATNYIITGFVYSLLSRMNFEQSLSAPVRRTHNQRQFIKIPRNILVTSIITETKSNFRRSARQSVTAREDE